MTTAPEADLVSAALRQPQRLGALTLAGWEVLIRQARRAGLLGRIACMLDAQGTLDAVPTAPRMHLVAALTLTEAQHAEARRELDELRKVVEPMRVVPVLLKGTAYVAAGLLPALGRSFGDIDILVARSRLPELEAALMAHGWATTHHSNYDQRYYRKWMHELPPMRHIRRHTVIHVHHAILPLTARLRPSSDKLLAAAQPLPDWPGFKVLQPIDMVLHSMVHLFHNDDLSRSLRDLSDLDLLLRDFGRQPAFWLTLVERASELDLARPLHYGLRYTSCLLATPMPQEVLDAAARNRPNWPLQRLADALWARALRPQHEIASDTWSRPARAVLVLRAHWLRMPPGLLLRHLTVKALRLHEDKPTPA